MKHLIEKEKNIMHGTIGWLHTGNDGQYCEAGETVEIKWQPDAGWGLSELVVKDSDDNDVIVTDNTFIMPDKDVTVSAVFKRFVVGDWTSGKDAKDNEGKVLGFDQNGNIVPTDITFDGNEGDVMVSDGAGYIQPTDGSFTSKIRGNLQVGSLKTTEDIIIGNEDNSYGITMFSPDGTEWYVSVNNDGEIEVTQA